MNILKDKGYSAACKDLAPTANSYSDLMNKVLKLYKIKGKKDKGYDGVRMEQEGVGKVPETREEKKERKKGGKKRSGHFWRFRAPSHQGDCESG